ncbi:MAG: trigger factor [Anaerolineales bacterium]|nr:trigger factor [Anaerolineales bacterium]
MKIEQTYLEDHQIELTVEADQDTFEKAKHLAAKELAKGKKIPGYRPGKAPYQLIVNHFGESAIIDQALEHFLDDIYPKILEEVEKEPYGPGQVKEIKSFEPPTFILNIPLQPEVTLGEYREVRIKYEQSEVSSADMDKVIERMLSQQASVEEVDHPAEEGNLVDTSLDSYPADSDPDDEDSYLLKNQPLPVMIKSKDEDFTKEWPFPGFSRQLLGISAGDFLDLTYEFPEDDSVDEDYRGKEVIYKVSVDGIRERVLPELNDDFVKTISELETVSELKEQIQEELTAQLKIEEANTYVNQILEAVLEDAEVKFPPQMLENEIEGEVRELETRLKSQGMDLEMYLGIQDMEEEGLREQIKPNAEKRIIHGLLIGKISEAEDLDINPEDITGEFQSIINDHFGDDESSRTAYMNSGDSVALLNRVSSQVITRKTLDFLMAVAKGEDITEFLKKEEDDIEEDIDSESSPKEEGIETSPDEAGEQDTAETEFDLDTETEEQD